MVAESCAFRPAVLTALRDCGRMWRTVFENGNLEATTAMVRTDLAVTAWLVFTVPPWFEILSPESELPALPPYAINLHLPETVGGQRWSWPITSGTPWPDRLIRPDRTPGS